MFVIPSREAKAGDGAAKGAWNGGAGGCGWNAGDWGGKGDMMGMGMGMGDMGLGNTCGFDVGLARSHGCVSHHRTITVIDRFFRLLKCGRTQQT